MDKSSQQAIAIIKSSRLICYKLTENLAYELTEAEAECVGNFKLFLEAGLLQDYRHFPDAQLTLFEAALLIGYIDKRKGLKLYD